jgi:hypothetical protein
MVAATENFIGNFIALSDISNYNLFALSDHNPINSSSVMGGTRPTPTERFNLKGVNAICQLNEAGRSRKELGAEIGENPKGVDIDSEAINNFCQAIDLIWLIELGFIADDVINAIAHRKMLDYEFMDIEFRLNLNRIRFKAQARADNARTGSILICEDQARASATFMVMGSLQCKGGFTAIHCSAVVHQFSHGGILPLILQFCSFRRRENAELGEGSL